MLPKSNDLNLIPYNVRSYYFNDSIWLPEINQCELPQSVCSQVCNYNEVQSQTTCTCVDNYDIQADGVTCLAKSTGMWEKHLSLWWLLFVFVVVIVIVCKGVSSFITEWCFIQMMHHHPRNLGFKFQLNRQNHLNTWRDYVLQIAYRTV